jgi:NO-binding membrane sensor protein with MHYT domain
MHFVAMMGFSVEGTPIRYDVPLTVLSLVMAIAVVSAGVFTAGYGRSRITSVALGGLGTGLGVAAMHWPNSAYCSPARTPQASAQATSLSRA